MFVFLAIMGAGFILLVGGSVFGHDHEFGHDLGGHDSGGHDHSNENQGVVSIFSMKVIGTFIMGFGAGGVLAKYGGLGWVLASFAGVGVGVLLGACMYGVLRMMYGHQANSLVYSDELVDQQGVVTIPIDKDAVGEVNVSLGEQNLTYLARASKGNVIPKGSTVKVIASLGNQLLVEQVN